MHKIKNFLRLNVVISVLVTISAVSARKCPVSENCKLKNLHELDLKDNLYLDAPNRTDPEWEKPNNGSDQYVDMVFVVEGSSSMSDGDFDNVKRWMLTFVQNFDLSTGKFQVGMVQYSHWYRWRKANNQNEMKTEVALGSCRNSSCLDEKLSKVKHIGHTAFAGFAINKTVNEDFVVSSSTAIKVMILLTISASNDQVLHSANYARQKEIHAFAIGLSRNVNFNELRNIATGDPRDNNRIYPLWSVDELQMITDSLVNEIEYLYVRRVCQPLTSPVHGIVNCSDSNNIGSRCSIHCSYEGFSVLGVKSTSCLLRGEFLEWDQRQGTCGVCEAKFDLLIIVDSSSSVRCQGFHDLRRFLVVLLDSVLIGADSVQVALMRYYSDVYPEFGYDEYQSKEALLKAVRTLQYCGKGTRTGNAIRFASRNQFLNHTGRRPTVPHITLLITDGVAMDNVKVVSKELQMISHVYSIGVRKASLDELNSISSKPILPRLNTVFRDYRDLLNTTVIREILTSFCETSISISNVSCDVEQLESNVTCSDDDISNSKRMLPGAVCRLPCTAGYRNPGKSKALCTYDGTWQQRNWKCIERECEANQLDENAIAECGRSGSSRLCFLFCKAGFEIAEAEDDSTCERSGEKILACPANCQKTRGGGPKWSLSKFRCKETNNCSNTSCVNGKCEIIGEKFNCQCDQGYTGSRCEINIYDCNECHNGRCRDDNGSDSCVCDDGYTGKFCQENINECASNPCKNDGQCDDQINNYTCNCRSGYTGYNCEIASQKCDSNPCQNGGTCRSTLGGFQCQCDRGFEGEVCDINVDDCHNNSCSHYGHCVDSINEYVCACDAGYTGKFCDHGINQCDSNPCGDHGTCEDLSNNYKCDCDEGYSGARCQVLLDPCRSQPCMNGALCKTHSIRRYSCSCSDGFRGLRCEFDKDECSEVPSKCQNSATCINTHGSYRCQCSDGYEGPFCEHKSCGLPQMRSTKGQIQCSRGATIGSLCRIICPLGTRLRSNKNDDAINPITQISITCLESGEWTASRFINRGSNSWQCVERSCPPLHRKSSSSDVHYALGQNKITSNRSHLIRCTDGYKVGSLCTLKCYSTYSIGGASTRKCGMNGIWSGKTWRCVPRQINPNAKSCAPSNMPFVNNGKYTCPQGHGPGKYCSIECAPGFIQDARTVSKLTCVRSKGLLLWRKSGDAKCHVGECESVINLQSTHIQDSKIFDMISSSRTDKFQRHKCRTGAVITMNITTENDILMFLHYGESISGHHMSLVIDKISDNEYRSDKKSFSIVGLGNKVFLKGITDRGSRSTPISRQDQISPNSIIELHMSYNQWKWRSASQEWFADLKRSDIPHHSWYTVRMGLNRGSKVDLDGYGLCKVCFTHY